MCGRFSLGLPYDEIQHLHGYNAHVGEWVNQDNFAPRHNIAPRSNAPVVRRRAPGGAHDEEASDDTLVMQTMKWGLVPHWSKHEDTSMNTTNARCESLLEGGGMWQSIKGRKRCAIPCEGYYEWLKKGKDRLPHFTKHKNGNLMLLAGLYDCVTLEGQTEPLWTFTIVTTDANSDFNWLHDRQPVILSTTEALTTWLDTSSQTWNSKLSEIVKPYHDSSSPLECYQVPKEVGKVGTESPTFIQPIAQRKDGIQAMFAKQKEMKLSSPASTPSSSQTKSQSQIHSTLSASSSPNKKRKRSESLPIQGNRHEISATTQGDDERDEGEGSKVKSRKTESTTWEDDSDIECIEPPTKKPPHNDENQEDSDIEEISPPKASQLSLSTKSKTNTKVSFPSNICNQERSTRLTSCSSFPLIEVPQNPKGKATFIVHSTPINIQNSNPPETPVMTICTTEGSERT
ncbi:hypothetical protein NLI96_g6540 [Meripilus lineatus]|uniref:DUF159-domain-containing protein n=1 Tax=Meripilus lineatus TaxID=2056292 RepID=A0AAD5V1D6_9APHY|nr:hypothetical protein NLI96_g6540 [Physisporinus lineatus]